MPLLRFRSLLAQLASLRTYELLSTLDSNGDTRYPLVVDLRGLDLISRGPFEGIRPAMAGGLGE